MKRSFAFALLLVITSWSLGTSAHDGKKHDEKTVTLEGEVVDSSCFLSHGGKGKGHKKCALDCLTKKGLPPAFLTKDGKLYLLTAGHDEQKIFKKALETAGDQITITATIVKKGGMQAVMLKSIQ